MADEKNVGLDMKGDSLERRSGAYDAVLNDPEMDALTLYEKKALLVNRELDSYGMGKYQVRRPKHAKCVLELSAAVVYILLVRFRVLDRSHVRSSIRSGDTSSSAGVGLSQWVSNGNAISYRQLIGRQRTSTATFFRPFRQD